jgi:tetratricopeptide (TPR) repeat protein
MAISHGIAAAGGTARGQKVTLWQKNTHLPCPCGSSVEYRSCCEPLINENKATSSLQKAALAQLNADDIAQAERLYRAHFVQYLEWIHAHTLPFLATGDPVSKQLLEIDTDATVEIIGTIAHYRARLGHETEIIPFIDHAASVIPLPGLEKHLAYLRAAWLFIALGDRDGAARELEILGDILEYGRREALELYLDVLGDRLSERQVIAIAENIVSHAGGDDHVAVQYTAIKTLALLQIGETNEALRILMAVLTKTQPPSQVETSDQIAAVWQLSKAWALYGKLTHDGGALERAAGLYGRIPEGMLTPVGNAALQLDLGWMLFDNEHYVDAVKAYRRSLQLNPSIVAQIHLAHSLVLSGGLDEARLLLSKVQATGISDTLKLEFFAAKGALAIAAEDGKLSTETVSELRDTVCKNPFWETQKQKLMVELLDFSLRPEAKSPVERQRWIVRFLGSINEMVELKPNFFGLGLNINKMIDKLTERLGK